MIEAIVALAAAAAQPAAIDGARRRFSGCVTALIRSNLASGTAPEAFDLMLEGACKTEEAAFRTTVIAADVAAGTRRSEAEANAKLEVDDILANSRERYADYRETNTQPR